MVERQFDQKILIFQSDGGGEYSAGAFINHLRQLGIIHHMSCPKTPEQNGMAERKHRNITELGLTMMVHSKIPKRFWVDAFSTSVFLINRLPSSVLNMSSPFQALFGKNPDFSSFRVFGSKCFPYLRDYASNKLGPKSMPYVFIGYSSKNTRDIVVCILLLIVFISLGMLFFYEHIFPFATPHLLHTSLQNHLMTSFKEWVETVAEPSTSSPPFNGPQEPVIRPTAPLNSPTNVILTVPVLSSNDPSLQSPSPPCPPPINGPQELVLSPIAPLDLPTNATPTDSMFSPCDKGIQSSHPPRSPPSLSMCPDQGLSSATNASLNGDTSSPSSPHDPPIPVSHPMVTHSKIGIIKPNPRYALLSLIDIPQEPKIIKAALQHEGWTAAMKEELTALKRNDTWELVPRSPHMNVVGSKWVYKTKICSNGTLERLKARLVAKVLAKLKVLTILRFSLQL
jgi:hypothetical protein